MSVKRTPPGRSGSLSDISSPYESMSEPQITYRKRKEPEHNCNCFQELQEFRRDITSLLDKFTNSQEATLKYMRESISEMRAQLNEISTSTNRLNDEQKNIKIQITDIVSKNNSTEQKIKSIEADITQIKTLADIKRSSSQTYENIILEIQERNIREKNIILVGVPECRSNNIEEGRNHDKAEVEKILNSLIEECPRPKKTFRLGKYNPQNNRKIKVCFESEQIAKLILRSRDKLQQGYKIYSDQTVNQQNYFKALKNELSQRIANGEQDIAIKYVRGTPKIVGSNQSKN